MAQQHFGTRLAEARRRRGLTLEQVHRQLRITPAILDALESGDFRHMPFKGHARNMVSSYARYLGLNPEEITKQFLKEYHDFENHEIHARSLPRSISYSNRSDFESSAYDQHSSASQSRASVQSRGAPQSRGASQSRSSVQSRYASQSTASMSSRATRSIWDRPIPDSELNLGTTSRTYESRRPASTSTSTSTMTSRRAPSGVGTPVNRYGPGSYTPRPSLPMRIFGTLFKSPVVLIVFLIILLAGLLVLWALLANSCNRKEQTVNPPINTSNVQSNGGNTNGTTPNGDTANGGTTSDQPGNNNTTTPQYESFVLTVEPRAGEGPWVEVIVDGQTVFHNYLTKKETWTVTRECIVNSGQPNNTIVTRDIARVDFVINAYGTGSITLTAREKAAT